MLLLHHPRLYLVQHFLVLSLQKFGWFVVTTHAIALLPENDAPSGKLKIGEVSTVEWRTVFFDTKTSVSEITGNYTIRDFRKDIQHKSTRHIKFEDISDLEIIDRWRLKPGPLVKVTFEKDGKVKKFLFAKIKQTYNGNPDFAPVDWEPLIKLIEDFNSG